MLRIGKRLAALAENCKTTNRKILRKESISKLHQYIKPDDSLALDKNIEVYRKVLKKESHVSNLPKFHAQKVSKSVIEQQLKIEKEFLQVVDVPKELSYRFFLNILNDSFLENWPSF